MRLEYGCPGTCGRDGGIEVFAKMKLKRRHTQASRQQLKTTSLRNIDDGVAACCGVAAAVMRRLPLRSAQMKCVVS